MKHLKTIAHFLFIGLLFFTISSCNNGSEDEKIAYGVATKQLIQMVESDPKLKLMLISSIDKAKNANPNRDTNPAQNLQEYYEFVSWAETSMPWTLLKKDNYPEIFNNTFQSMCYFYFLIDQPLVELEGKGLVNNSLQYAEPFASWLVKFSKSWGKYLDTEDSWSDTYYKMALKDTAFGLQNGWYESSSKWKTFNQFFSRNLKSPKMRPIASPKDDSIVASYADSEPQGVWLVDSNSKIIDNNGVVVKSSTLKSITKLIGEDSKYASFFANGTFTHSFLNINDYHRYHFPLSGTIKEVRIIQGINPTGGALWWDKEHNRYAFNPSAVLGWQSIETRGCVILETEKYGLVALLPIGMVVVGSVNFEQNILPGVQVKKGDMLGSFAFGGSDFIMIFQDNINFTLDSPKKVNGDSYKHLLMGERLGYLTNRN